MRASIGLPQLLGARIGALSLIQPAELLLQDRQHHVCKRILRVKHHRLLKGSLRLWHALLAHKLLPEHDV